MRHKGYELTSTSLGLKVVLPGGVPEYYNAPEGFRWNLNPGGWTEASDWNPKPYFGGGLHLWAWAHGCLNLSTIWLLPDSIWLAVEYETASAVGLFVPL